MDLKKLRRVSDAMFETLTQDKPYEFKDPVSSAQEVVDHIERFLYKCKFEQRGQTYVGSGQCLLHYMIDDYGEDIKDIYVCIVDDYYGVELYLFTKSWHYMVGKDLGKPFTKGCTSYQLVPSERKVQKWLDEFIGGDKFKSLKYDENDLI